VLAKKAGRAGAEPEDRKFQKWSRRKTNQTLYRMLRKPKEKKNQYYPLRLGSVAKSRGVQKWTPLQKWEGQNLLAPREGAKGGGAHGGTVYG